MKKGIIFDIKKFAVHDGPGIRTTVFLKGCPLSCKWCHNPESLSVLPQEIIKKNRIGQKLFSSSETIGKEVFPEEVIAEVLKDKVFYEDLNGGVTFSGGEPLFQIEFLTNLLTLAKQEGLRTVVDTSGFTTSENFQKIVDLTDLFLYDIKLINNDVHTKFTGVSNVLILENIRLLQDLGKSIQVRIPLIPGITDTDKNLDEIIRFLQKINYTNRIALLPYHTTAKEKYHNLKIDNYLSLHTQTEEKISMIKQKFTEEGFSVKLGG